MGTAVGTFSARTNHRIRLETQDAGENVSGNYSQVNWQLYAEKTSSSSSYYLSNGGGGSVNIGGNSIGIAAWQYDFRSQTTILLGSGSVLIGHNPDGTGSYSFSASVTAPGTLGSASCGSSEGLPTIPRASTATFSPNPIDAGQVLTINTNRASSSFTHTISYVFGSQSGTIDTGIADTDTWTVPLSLLNEIPNALSGSVAITLDTYNGGTYIGSATSYFTMTVPASVVPTTTAITDSEATAGVAAAVGAYVQGISSLALAVTGAAGAYSSTIASYAITVNGQTITASSGTTGIITASGTLTVSATVTDSRGRTTTRTKTITVLAYAPPVLTTATTQRALVTGTPDDNGTYIRANLNVAVQSLLVGGVQKNTLTYRISTRAHGGTTWTLKKTVTPSGVTFNSYDLVSTYSIASSWDVLIEVVDLFSTTASTSQIATAAIFQHWDAALGIGIGKYRQNGMLDVLGEIYKNNGQQALDIGQYATDADITTGTSTSKYLSPASLSSRLLTGTVDAAWTYGLPNVTLTSGPNSGTVVSAWIGRWEPTPGDTVLLEKIGATYYIASPGVTNAPKYLKQFQLALNPTYITNYDSDYGNAAYNEGQNDTATQQNQFINGIGGRFAPITYTKSGSSWVILSGLAYTIASIPAGTVLATLPVGFRPLTQKRFQMMASNGPGSVIVNTNGDVVAGCGYSSAQWITFAAIKFNNDASLTRTPLALGLSGWVDGGISAYGVASVAIDAYGTAFSEGQIKNGTTTDNTAFTVLPTAFRPKLGRMQHMATCSGPETAGAFGGVRAIGSSVSPANSMSVYTGTGFSNALVSLDGALWDVSENGGATEKIPVYVNSWHTYSSDSDYGAAHYWKRPDGLVRVSGLVGGGAGIPTSIFFLPQGSRPLVQIMHGALDSGQAAPTQNYIMPSGEIRGVTGATTWRSMDAILFAAAS